MLIAILGVEMNSISLSSDSLRLCFILPRSCFILSSDSVVTMDYSMRAE
jgi:hypothetical protein